MDGFEIIKQLGKGSFSLVLVVKRKEDNKIYAIKRVQISNMSEKEKSNALNEVRLLSSINHQNIIGYKESFYDEQTQTLNIVLEYADGGDLRSKIQERLKTKRYFKENEIWGIFIQLITGLRYLHAHNIIHRDLKTANIFLTNNHICKLGDLNVSKIAKSGLLYTQTGTPYYASPEMWEEKPYDVKSDIWSIGCILYEMCCLTPPFKGKNLSLVYQNIIKAKYTPIPSGYYSKELINMVTALLQVNPKDRPSCEEMFKCSVVRNKIYSIYGQISDDNGGDCTSNNSRNGYNKNDKEFEMEFMDTIRINNDKEIKRVLPKTKKYASSNYNNNNNNMHLRCTTAGRKIKANDKTVIETENVIQRELNIKQYALNKEMNNNNKAQLGIDEYNKENKNTTNTFKRNKSLSRCCTNIISDQHYTNVPHDINKLIIDYKSKCNKDERHFHPISRNNNNNNNSIEHMNVHTNKNTSSRSHTPSSNIIPISCQSLRNISITKIHQILSHHGRNIRLHSNSLSKFDHFTEDFKEDNVNNDKAQQKHTNNECYNAKSKQTVNNTRKSCDYPKPPIPHLSSKTQLVPNRKESFNYSNKHTLKLNVNPFQILENPNIRKILSTHIHNKLPGNKQFTNSSSTVNTSENGTPK